MSLTSLKPTRGGSSNPSPSVFAGSWGRRRLAVIGIALLITLSLPLFAPGLDTGMRIALVVIGLAIAAVALFTLPRTQPTETAPPEGEKGRSALRNSLQLALYLSPVLLLSIIFPIVSPRMAQADVGGVSLSLIVLAVSITVPWLAQAACLPIYRILGDLIEGRNMTLINRRFGENWAITLLQSLPILAVFAVPVAIFTGWGPQQLGVYVLLAMLHVVFVQTLILSNISERRGMWALAWGSYGAALLIAPTVWWLPPVLGTLSQFVLLRPVLPFLGAFHRLSAKTFAADAIRGLLLGSVLWADKFFLYLVSDGGFKVTIVFAAMLPAVIAYNFYFVRLAPTVDNAVQRMRSSITNDPISKLRGTSVALTTTVDRAVLQTAAVGMVLTSAVALVLGGVDPSSIVLAVTVTVCTWFFMMLTLLSYELDYIGERIAAQALGAVHLAVCATAFIGFRSDTAYLALLVVDIFLVAAAWTLYRRVWTKPEYTLFWRHATSW